MSSNISRDSFPLYPAPALPAAAAVSAWRGAARRRPGLPLLDVTIWLPVLVALLLIVSFGIVAAPLVVKYLPLLLGR